MAKALDKRTKYSKKVVDRIYNLLCEGHSLVKVSEMVSVKRNTIYTWINKYPEFRDKVQSARDIQARRLVDDMIEIADDDSKDVITDEATGRKYPNAAAVARSKLRLLVREKLAGHLSPGSFGPVANGGGVTINNNGTNVFAGLVITAPKDEDEEVIEIIEEGK